MIRQSPETQKPLGFPRVRFSNRTNWLANAEWTQPLFPPVLLSNILQLPAIKSFRDESFLREKYLVEGRSPAKIANLTLSSKKTVRKYLQRFKIPLRPEDRPQLLQQARFGTRRVNGQLVPSPREMKALDQMKALRASGRSYREIVQILNQLKIPCRKKGAKWHVKTVFAA